MQMKDHIKDTMIHKENVIHSGQILIDYLIKENRVNDALYFANRLSSHDNSKLIYPDEIGNFLKMPSEGNNMRNASEQMPSTIKVLIEAHWKNNRHHPEHFADYHDMNEYDIMEMCCDWHARSIQFGTNFMEFVLTRQENRFHFDKAFFKKVMKYCKILDSANVISGSCRNRDERDS